MNTTPIYYESAEHARQYGELDQYRASARASTECRNMIDQAIAKHFDGMHLRPEALTDVIEEYPMERIATILAVTLKDREHDGRFSRSNREWADKIQTPPESPIAGYAGTVLRSHSAILNGYVDMFRKATV